MEQTIGLLGGGQLGQMLCEAANPLGMKVIILDAEGSPAMQINAKNTHVNGSFTNKEAIQQLARQSDILTVEIEHVDTFVLEEIAEKGVDVTDKDGKKGVKKVPCSPHWKTLRMIQDKYSQKEHLISHGVKVADSVAVEASEAGLGKVGKSLGYPYMLKARKDAYDGRGNFPVKSESEIPEALETLKGRSLYAEKWASFKMELAVMVVKTTDDASDDISSTIAYPAVETVHEDSICKLVYAPARNVTEALRAQAQSLARKAVSCLWGKGVFGVELFVMEDDTILLNEIAPRPHNSGHYTIEACPTMSQYKSQLLAITGLMPAFPNNTIPMAVPSAIMLNILGGPSPESYKSITRQAISIPNLSLHLYGKESKPARKIGHVTIIAGSMSEAEKAISPLVAENDAQRAERKSPTSKPSAETIATLTASGQPLIAITMGSDSDLPTLKGGLEILKKLEIPYLVTITSAHRTPDRMTLFAKEAAEKGIRVIIAAAGGAAHLPGMIAASTPLPVIGVPVKGSTLDGMDSLLSIVQMPRGVPVATVAINNSVNAALLAARIIGSSDLAVRRKIEKYTAESREEVLRKSRKLEEGGWEAY